MTEKVPHSDYISVVINFKNRRFMSLVKEDALISDLIKEIEKTFSKLCSVKVKIKTLKNSVNAVLPDWYPVAPLIRNQDEIYAFSDNAAEVLNVDLTKPGDSCTNIAHNVISPLGSIIMPDSGFTSPVTKPGTTGEPEGPCELTGVDKDCREVRQLNNLEENPSQDEGTEILSEIFSLKDHIRKTPTRKFTKVERSRKDEGTPRKGIVDHEKESSVQTEQDKLKGRTTPKKIQSTKTATNSPRERNVMLENGGAVLEESFGISKGRVQKRSGNGKGLNMSKDKAVVLEKDSSSDSSDESSSELDDSAKKDKMTKKQHKKSLEKSENNNSESAEVTKEPSKASKQNKPSERSKQDTNLPQTLQIKRNNSSKTRMKSVQENNVHVDGGHAGDDSTTVDEAMDFDKSIYKKVTVVNTSGAKSRLIQVSGESEKPSNDENMEVDDEKEVAKKSGKNINVVSQSTEAVAKAGNKESESSDSSSESEDMRVVEGGDTKKGKITTDVKANKLNDAKTDSPKVTGKKGGKPGEDTMISDQKNENANKKGSKDDESSSGSSSSDSDTDSDVKKSPRKLEKENGKQNEQEVPSVKKGDDVVKKHVRQSGKNDRESKRGKKDNSTKEPSDENERGDSESDFSFPASSWTDSNEDGEKTANQTTKDKNGTTKQNDKSQIDVIDGVKSKAKDKSNKKAKTTAAHGKAEDNNTKEETKRKGEVKTDDKDKQTNLKTASSPAKTVSLKRSEENKNTVALPAKSVARSKKSVSTKNVTDLSKSHKRKVKDSEGEETSDDSSVSTLRPPFTQLPAKDKVQTRNEDKSKDGLGGEKAAKKIDEIAKDGEKNRKQNSADDKTSHAPKTKPNDTWLPQTPSTSTSRKSAVMLSASKVASWLLSNPVSDSVAEEETSHEPTKTKKHSKNKTNTEVEVPSSEMKGKQKTKAGSKTKANVELCVDTIESSKAKEKNQTQKRKLDGVSEQEKRNKKHKKKKTSDEKNDKQIDGETRDDQENVSTKPGKSKRRKNSSISLPKISKGLSALVEDENDYNAKSSKKSKKQKLTPPIINRVKHAGFLTPSTDNVARKTIGSKTPKSRIKKIPSSAPSKTVEMNAKEHEFLNSGVVNLETLLNDESIKW